MNDTSPQPERRTSVRMTSRLLFAAHPLAPEAFDRLKRDCDAGISLYNRRELAEIQAMIGGQEALSRLRDRDRDLADFLQHLDGKLTAIMQKLDPRPGLLDTLELQEVNISGGGLAFWSPTPYDEGTVIEHHIVIPPLRCFICCCGEVISCHREDDGPEPRYRISERFALIMERDREELIGYNFEQQARQLQRRRLEHEQ